MLSVANLLALRLNISPEDQNMSVLHGSKVTGFMAWHYLLI